MNRRVPQPPTQPIVNNRHSFALGDTEELSRMFNRIGTDWNTSGDSTTATSTTTNRIPTRASATNLRPKSVMELGGTIADSSFSNSWLNQRQPTLFNQDQIIERPHSADISSWPVQPHPPAPPPSSSSSSWKPLSSQHDLTWKEPARFSQIVPDSVTTSSNTALKHDDIIRSSRRASMNPMHNNNNNNRSNNAGFPHYLSPPATNINSTSRRSSSIETAASDSMLGYGSDQSDHSSRYRNTMPNAPPPTTINENKDDDIDMELLKGIL